MIRIKDVKLDKEQTRLFDILIEQVNGDDDILESVIYEYVYLKTKEVE